MIPKGINLHGLPSALPYEECNRIEAVLYDTWFNPNYGPIAVVTRDATRWRSARHRYTILYQCVRHWARESPNIGSLRFCAKDGIDRIERVSLASSEGIAQVFSFMVTTKVELSHAIDFLDRIAYDEKHGGIIQAVVSYRRSGDGDGVKRLSFLTKEKPPYIPTHGEQYEAIANVEFVADMKRKTCIREAVPGMPTSAFVIVWKRTFVQCRYLNVDEGFGRRGKRWFLSHCPP
jgi:hypothetical protein